jgi:hypothetical protein
MAGIRRSVKVLRLAFMVPEISDSRLLPTARRFMAAAIGFKWGFWTFGILLCHLAGDLRVMARDAPNRGPAKSFAEIVRPLKTFVAGC